MRKVAIELVDPDQIAALAGYQGTVVRQFADTLKRRGYPTFGTDLESKDMDLPARFSNSCDFSFILFNFLPEEQLVSAMPSIDVFFQRSS